MCVLPSIADIFYQSARPNPATNKSRIAHAKPHSSPASAAPAASHKSSYRKCPGGKHFDFPPLLGAGALVDRKLDFSQSAARYLQDDNNGGN
jgi:hypothetical protein